MRHITADTLQQDNETYRRFLEPNGWSLEDGSYLINKINSNFDTGTTGVDTTMPLLKEGSTIWVDPAAIRGVDNLKLSNANLKKDWRIKNVKFRIIPIEKLVIKGNKESSYPPLMLLGPENFDVDLRSVQFPAKNLSNENEFPLFVDTEGIKVNMNTWFTADGLNPNIKFIGWSCGGGSFAGLRLFETARHAKVSGEVSHFLIKNTISENIYQGSIKPLHAKFVNFKLRNGLLINAGAEALQTLNFGEGSLIENISIINTGVEWPSSFQNYQRGTFQLKAGGGSFKVRKIFCIGYGSPGIGIFSAGPATDTVTGITHEGVKPGDKIEISDIYYDNGAGPFLYVDKSNIYGAEWILDNVHVGRINSRMGEDTKLDLPYSFLMDVYGATDKVIFKSITTDKMFPLVGKYGKYEVLQHNVVDEVVKPKFINSPFLDGEQVIAYYHTYNQESQGQFYPVAGQTVKYRKGDIAYYDYVGSTDLKYPRTWWKALQDVEGEANGPGVGWEQLYWDAKGTRSDQPGYEQGTAQISPPTNFLQAPDSPLLNKAGFEQDTIIIPEPTEPTYEELKAKVMALSQELKDLAVKAELLESDNAAKTDENIVLKNKIDQIQAMINQIQFIITQGQVNG